MTQMDTAMLRLAGRIPPAPCRLVLGDDSELAIDRWLRVLPGKRLTGAGRHADRAVLAKLFIDRTGSGRHRERERRGIDALIANGIATPRPLAAGTLADGGDFLLTEFIDDASILAQDDPLLEAAFATLGRMHACGLVHDDPHLGNFLVRGDALYVLDGDAVRAGATPDEMLGNLALLIAQLPPDRDAAPLLAAYRRGHPAATFDPARLHGEVGRMRRRRLDDYLGKCLRDCSLFQVERRWDRFVAVARDEADFLAPLLADPDRWIERGTPLKQGHTATLALVGHGGRQLVIKRYNIKSAGHALSRAWRPSRAWHAWREAHRLRFLGIPTPRPLALIERRVGPLRGRAWLVTDYCAGTSLAQLPLDEAIMRAAGELFRRLVAARITHGDLKASNLLWHDGRIHLVDLDATRQHAREGAFRRAWQRDRARFLRNWAEGSASLAALDAALPPA